MLERMMIVLGVALLLVGGWALFRLWLRYQVRQLGNVSPFAGFAAQDKPTVIAFSTPSCAECRTRQAPALKQLASQFGERIEIRSLSALEQPELVAEVGILTVPATVIVDPKGAVRALNLGFADANRLAAQVRAVL